MLVLERAVMESVIIDDKIKITVIKTTPGRVRLAFEAPRDVAIHREEIWEKIKGATQPPRSP